MPITRLRKAVMIALLLIFCFNLSAMSSSPKFLIIHVDGVSADFFFEAMEAGGFPNMERVFSDGNMIKHGLTLFPGGTETILTRFKEGKDTSEGDIVSWAIFDREEERIVGRDALVFLNILPNVARRSLGLFFYGIFVFDVFGGVAMHNVPSLLEKYNVVEYYWYSSDGVGHIFGQKAQLENLKRFDSYFGDMVERLGDIDDLNIILYGDHGMSYGDVIHVPTPDEAEAAAGDDFLAFSYPHIYLAEGADAENIAEKAATERDFDYAFYRGSENMVIGFHESGNELRFKGSEAGISYTYEGEDTLGYYDLGYDCEYLSHNEWLALTRDAEYPATPPLIYNLIMNPNSGDVLAIVNPPRIPSNILLREANHAGLSRTCLMVPILLRGPDLEHLYHEEEMWLHELLVQIDALDFAEKNPRRENHSLRVWWDLDGQLGGSLSFSPAYRWRIGVEYDEDYKAWGEFDILSTYLARIWLAAGLQYSDNKLAPLGGCKVEFTVGNLSLNYRGETGGEEWDSAVYLSYRLLPEFSLEALLDGAVGLRWEW